MKMKLVLEEKLLDHRMLPTRRDAAHLWITKSGGSIVNTNKMHCGNYCENPELIVRRDEHFSKPTNHSSEHEFGHYFRMKKRKNA